jgi:hypothetical protein
VYKKITLLNTQLCRKSFTRFAVVITLAYVFAVLLTPQPLHGQQLEKICKDSARQYSCMWWVHSIKEKQPLLFAVKTNQYAFIFDYERLNFRNFFIKDDKQTVNDILKLQHNQIFDKTEIPGLVFGIETGNKLHPCRKSSLRTENCQLIHCGRFLQHRFINRIPDLTECNPHHSGLEVIAWADRLSLVLRVLPEADLHAKSIAMQFTVPENYQELHSKNNKFKVYKHIANRSGYIITTSEEKSQLSASGNTVAARLTPPENLQAGKRLQVGLIIYPVSDVESALTNIMDQENHPVKIVASQKVPVDSALSVGYDRMMGWHTIRLRNDVTDNIDKENNRMEKVLFTIENTTEHDKTVRLNFSKEDEIYGVTGISGILRDNDGYPTGIPVQLSKNWHNIDFNKYGKHLYGGLWFHGLTMLNIAAGNKITLEYTGVNAHWGGVPAASHAQLCLVGWSNNQQWDQAAIGAWGENICYEPDLDQASAPLLDLRPLLIVNVQHKKWGWTGNVGGADFFNLQKKDGNRAWHTAMKTHYKRYCPNLTEVIYEGEILGGDTKIRYEASTERSDDITRGIYRIRMDVKKNITFNEFNVFQMGAMTYNYALSKRIALGNEKGLLSDWKSVNGKFPITGTDMKKPLTGRVPWFCLYDSQISEKQSKRYIGGDRGFVIRSWKSRINGKTDIPPYWQETTSTDENRGLLGTAGSIISLTIPDGIGSLSAGDYIEAVIEMFVLPLAYEDYYGPNEALKEALKKNAGTWRMAYREAIGNDIHVTAHDGVVEQNYPVVIATKNDKTSFMIRGGVGFVPITIRGLSSYRIPILYRKNSEKWEKVDQSHHGNDFWQTDYDPVSNTWEFTYNIKMDNIKMDTDVADNQPTCQEFRFELHTQP